MTPSPVQDEELTTLSQRFRHLLASRYPFRHSKDFHDERTLKDAINEEKSKLMKQVSSELEKVAQEFERKNRSHRQEAMTHLENYSKFLRGKYKSTIERKLFENPGMESGQLAIFLKEEKLKIVRDFMEECSHVTTDDSSRGLEMELETKLDGIKNECIRTRTRSNTHHQLASGSGVRSQEPPPVYEISSDEDVKDEVEDDNLNLRCSGEGQGGPLDPVNSSSAAQNLTENVSVAAGSSSSSNPPGRRSSSDVGPSQAKKPRQSEYICDNCNRKFQEYPEYEDHFVMCQIAPRSEAQSLNANPISSIGNPSTEKAVEQEDDGDDDDDANDHDWNANDEEDENPVRIFNRTPRWSTGSLSVDKENLPSHIKIIQVNGTEYFKCEICEQGSQGRPGRSPQHIKNHTPCSLILFENFGYKCKACGGIFQKKADVRSHIWDCHRSRLG